MAKINLEIPDGKVSRVKDAMKGLFPIPKDGEGTPLFTEGQWVKESIRNFIKNSVARWEQSEAKREIKFTLDDSMVQ